MFKKGQTIIMTEDCHPLKKGDICILEKNFSGNLFAFKKGVTRPTDDYCVHQNNWQLVEKDWTNLEVGDVLVDEDEIERPVLEVLKNMFAVEWLSIWDFPFKNVRVCWVLFKDAKRLGWKIKDAVKEETVDIDGKKFSLSTIKEALKNYAN